MLTIALEGMVRRRLQAYEADPGFLREHAGIEENVLAGGYAYRQILELVQNGADAILEARDRGEPVANDARIHVLLRGAKLYVANTGAPLSEDGLDALLRSHSSRKRGIQIGRFGIGFKSLLRFGGQIDILTKNGGAIRFDPSRCRAELCRRFGVKSAPGLRLAWPLPPEARAEDPVFRELAWAETIVRAEIRNDGLLEHIRHEILSFPAEFLLFFPVPVDLVLDDETSQPKSLRVSVQGRQSTLHEGDSVSHWRMFSRDVRIVDQHALDDATHLHARDVVPVTWAMPIEGRREEAGRFWAFFPTQTPTYLPGILNAPWKLNSDRNAIVGGKWNAELMVEAAKMVAAAVPELSTPDDPARPLDAFPRRMQRKDEDAAPLVKTLWQQLETAVVVPDANGELRPARELLRHPVDDVPLAENWCLLASEKARGAFVHPSSLTGPRAGRLVELARRLEDVGDRADYRLRRSTLTWWFDAIASQDPKTAISVLQLVKSCAGRLKQDEWRSERWELAIVPTQSGKLATARDVVLAPADAPVPGREVVAAALQADPEARRILTGVLWVRSLDDDVWLSILSSTLDRCRRANASDQSPWESFWNQLHRAPAELQRQFVNKHRDQIRVRRRDGRWVLSDRVLLPGGLVADDPSSANYGLLADQSLHEADGELLTLLGITQTPGDGWVAIKYPPQGRGSKYIGGWLDACRDRYKNEIKNRANKSYLEPGKLRMPEGYALLSELKGLANAKLTLKLLDAMARDEFAELIDFGHSTNTDYARIEVRHPLAWYVMRYGRVAMGASTVLLSSVVTNADSRAFWRVPGADRIAGVVPVLSEAFPVVSATAKALRNFWNALVAETMTLDDLHSDDLVDLWSAAAQDGVVPSELPTRQGPVSLRSVFVTTSSELARRGRAAGCIVITLDAPTKKLWRRAGAQNLDRHVLPKWEGNPGRLQRVIEVFPELGLVMREAVQERAACQEVRQLRLAVMAVEKPAPCLMSGSTLMLDFDQLAALTRAERLDALVQEMATAEWLEEDPALALQKLTDSGVEERRARVAAGATLGERLLLAVGERVDPLRKALGEELARSALIQQCTPKQLAELVLAQLGPAALVVLSSTLQDEGLNPPGRWSASAAAEFVAALGFPPEFAAAPGTRREPEEIVGGPLELPPLHDFQQEVFDRLKSLLGRGSGRRRAVVSLPTGGGKTRVAVEAAVCLVLAPKRGRRSVLWVAQSDELCEQAVQAFRQVWTNRGAQGEDLRIVRLWGSNRNPAPARADQAVAVVATIQTLKSRMRSTHKLDWLREPGLVVVDECHHAIAPSYSELFRWLNAELGQKRATDQPEPPIIGLSATPHRTDDEESRRLAQRFDKRWLPNDQKQLHERLRDQGVLATVVYDSLQSGVGLTNAEFEKLDRLPEPWEGLEFESLLEAINQRLGADARRNQRLVDAIMASPEQSILFFSNSVAHAEEMSARLNLLGVAAAAISGSTSRAARRYFLHRFQAGQIRVLCNHSVLTTGFDAPRTDLVLIARQVFSPVRYMQMVGRGLRGEKNGGTATCRILTVMDNLGRFQDRHAWHYCQGLYVE